MVAIARAIKVVGKLPQRRLQMVYCVGNHGYLSGKSGNIVLQNCSAPNAPKNDSIVAGNRYSRGFDVFLRQTAMP
jgi:hypothetical protein